MPTDKADKAEVESETGPLESLSDAWDQLVVANDALAAAMQTGNREFALAGMRVLRSRIGLFDRAVAALLEGTQG